MLFIDAGHHRTENLTVIDSARCATIAAPSHALVSVPADPRRAREVRMFTSAMLAHWQLTRSDLDNAVLIVAELAANAAQHGRADLTVLLTRWRDAVHITVQDTGAPSNRDESTTGRVEVERGRGLAIVSALADWTRTRRNARGTQVCAGMRATSNRRLPAHPRPTAGIRPSYSATRG